MFLRRAKSSIIKILKGMKFMNSFVTWCICEYQKYCLVYLSLPSPGLPSHGLRLKIPCQSPRALSPCLTHGLCWTHVLADLSTSESPRRCLNPGAGSPQCPLPAPGWDGGTDPEVPLCLSLGALVLTEPCQPAAQLYRGHKNKIRKILPSCWRNLN